ncbi:ArsR/SmtB family transcription factor [Halosimplex salinum]|uniref:ArsR/SmtB family transcription factor n=1 Tax=Halosimplex salinum TaxID=1710538 RepID=UPI000F496AC0|nr:helix-turn-helix domain-containing protein [Halosimplex salinum]
MSGLIGRIQDRSATSDEALRVLDVEGEETDDVLDALATDTRRAVYRSLFEEPRTASEIAERIDSSVQNVHYHLSNLESAGLVEEIDTRYSEKGNEMTVYGPASDPLVIVGNSEMRPRVHRTLTDVVGGIGLLSVAAVFVQWGAERIARPAVGGNGAGPASPNATLGEPGSLGWLVFDVIEPGVLFFFACLALAAVVALALDR